MKLTRLILVPSVIFVGDYMAILFLSYLELCNSDWGDLWSIGNGIKLSTFYMLDSKAKLKYIMVEKCD